MHKDFSSNQIGKNSRIQPFEKFLGGEKLLFARLRLLGNGRHISSINRGLRRGKKNRGSGSNLKFARLAQELQRVFKDEFVDGLVGVPAPAHFESGLRNR